MTNAEIQVNEFVRTIDGYIRKVTQYNEKGSYNCLCWGACTVDKDYKHSKGISLKKIKKHSFNLIDLIEVGDYVKIDDFEKADYVCGTGKNCTGERYIELDYGQDGTECFYNSERIKTILTKELMELIGYRVN